MGNTSRNSYGIYSILPDGYIVNKGGFKRKLLNEPRQLSPDPTCILPYLYLGGHFTYKHPEIIERLGITHILNIASDMSPKEKAAVAIWKQNVVYKHIPIKSGVDYDITQHFEEAFQIIDHARRTNGKVLVHCKRGISRSGMHLNYLLFFLIRGKSSSWFWFNFNPFLIHFLFV